MCDCNIPNINDPKGKRGSREGICNKSDERALYGGSGCDLTVMRAWVHKQIYPLLLPRPLASLSWPFLLKALRSPTETKSLTIVDHEIVSGLTRPPPIRQCHTTRPGHKSKPYRGGGGWKVEWHWMLWPPSQRCVARRKCRRGIAVRHHSARGAARRGGGGWHNGRPVSRWLTVPPRRFRTKLRHSCAGSATMSAAVSRNIDRSQAH